MIGNRIVVVVVDCCDTPSRNNVRLFIQATITPCRYNLCRIRSANSSEYESTRRFLREKMFGDETKMAQL